MRTTKSGLCGCLAALVFALLVGFVLFVATMLGDCYPAPACRDDDRLVLFLGLAVVLALAALFGLCVRALLRWALRRRAEGRRAGHPPLWAIALGLPLLLLAIWCFIGLSPYFLM